MKISQGEKYNLVLEEIYNEVTIKSSDNEEIHLCMRDGAFEFTYRDEKYFIRDGNVYKGISVGSGLLNQLKEPPVTNIPREESENRCLHKSCPQCEGTGRKKNGEFCVHYISCTCPSCSSYGMVSVDFGTEWMKYAFADKKETKD